MNTNRDKAVSFGRDGGDVCRFVFLSMSQSRMLHPFQLRGEPERNIARWLCE